MTTTPNYPFETSYAKLLLFVNPTNTELVELYKKQIEEHNAKIISQYPYCDSGFDLICPNNDVFLQLNNGNYELNHEVKAEMFEVVIEKTGRGKTKTTKETNIPTSYFMMPRSSISKYPLLLANSVGLIDAGYRGNLIAKFKYVQNANSQLPVDAKNAKFVQIVNPKTLPIIAELVEKLSDTERKEGGFGSTGK
jgi:dUTP pyrophosphatase